MENHNTHLEPGFTLNNLVPAPANVAVLWDLLGPGFLTASPKCPSSSGTFQQLLPLWPKNLLDPTLLLGIHSSHQSTFRYGAVELQTVVPLLLLMELKPSPFSLFSLVPAAVSSFPLFLQLLLGTGCFSHILSPSQSPSSLHSQKHLPSCTSRSPRSLLRAVYLLNSVVQLVQIVVLSLQSVF